MNFLEKYRLKRQIKRLTEQERQTILNQSPYEIGWFQGEGFYVFLKSEPDFIKGYVTSLGEIMKEMAEDWVIEQYLTDKQNN